MFNPKAERSLTKAVEERLPQPIVIELWRMIDRLAASGQEMANPQSFLFAKDEKKHVLTVIHRQEKPAYIRSFSAPFVPELDVEYPPKVIVEDQGGPQKMMLGREYQS